MAPTRGTPQRWTVPAGKALSRRVRAVTQLGQWVRSGCSPSRLVCLRAVVRASGCAGGVGGQTACSDRCETKRDWGGPAMASGAWGAVSVPPAAGEFSVPCGVNPSVVRVIGAYWLWPDVGLLSLDRVITFWCTVCHRECEATLVAARNGQDLACPECFADLGRVRASQRGEPSTQPLDAPSVSAIAASHHRPRPDQPARHTPGCSCPLRRRLGSCRAPACPIHPDVGLSTMYCPQPLSEYLLFLSRHH